jgi:hypothetical protein
MPIQLRVMSWNVESLGWEKATAKVGAAGEAEIIRFIARAIVATNASIVGIMEVKSGIGQLIGTQLTALLNNNALPPPPPWNWRFSVSARQDGGTKEEYLVLWREQANVLQLNLQGEPAPTWLIGVVDNNALAGTANGANVLTPVQLETLREALANMGYLYRPQFRKGKKTQTDRIPVPVWNALSAAGVGAIVNLAGSNPPTLPFLPAERQALARRLVAIDALRFPTFDNRAPFVANFQVGNPPQPLTFVIYHAPKPGDTALPEAINMIGLSQPLANAQNLLVMGDFNVPFAQIGTVQARVWTREGPVAPVTRRAVFAPITGAPLNAPSRLANVLTSLGNRYRSDQSGAVSLAPLAVRSNAYDKIFLRSGPGVIALPNACAVDLVQLTAANQAPLFNPGLAQSTLALFRVLRGIKFLEKGRKKLQREAQRAQRDETKAQARLHSAELAVANAGPHPPAAKLKRVQSSKQDIEAAQQWAAEVAEQLLALTALLNLINTPAAVAPPGVGSAASVYRHAVSDHLPITIELEVP